MTSSGVKATDGYSNIPNNVALLFLKLKPKTNAVGFLLTITYSMSVAQCDPAFTLNQRIRRTEFNLHFQNCSA